MTESEAQQYERAPAPVPADVGVVMALPIEAGYFLDRLTKVRKYRAHKYTIVEGELAGRLIVVLLSGPGVSAAREGTEILLAGHRPRCLISAGFAGALDRSLARNHLVLPHEVVDLNGQHIAIDAKLPPIPGVERSTGRLMTVDRVIVQAAEKAGLRQDHGADLIDMESFAVANLARERSLPFIPIRIVSDDANHDLPPEVARLLTHSGSYRVGVAMSALWRRPSAIKDFWNLHAQAMEAADRLSAGIQRVLEVLPPA